MKLDWGFKGMSLAIISYFLAKERFKTDEIIIFKYQIFNKYFLVKEYVDQEYMYFEQITPFKTLNEIAILEQEILTKEVAKLI